MLLYDFSEPLTDVKVTGRVKVDGNVHTPHDEITNIRLAGFTSFGGSIILLGEAVRLKTHVYIDLPIAHVSAMFDGTEEKPELYDNQLWFSPLPKGW